ncbi:2,3-butanediol dehydrogenase [Corynebacterium glyciniphilum]|uniref:2,3-butanediol dehydrogenase n=1 Tax=Corynebacterium glyciniphilum TaxID=1404244 RepID=UPI003FD17EAC
MTTTDMRAALYYGPGDVRVETIEVPEPGPDQVLIRNELCGICGTDLHEYLDGPIFAPTSETPDPLTGESPPVVLGHEMVGIVEAVGNEVAGIEVGSRVAVEPRQTCGECGACRSGRRNCCPVAATIGLQGGGGGLSEYIAVDSSLVFDLNGLPAEEGVAIEPLAVACHAVARADVDVHGKTALVTGAGPIGCLITWVLRTSGADSVLVVEPGAHRRDTATAYGATMTVDPTAESLAEKLKDAGLVPDLAFDCAGVSVTLQSCLESVSVGGTVVNVAIPGSPLSVDLLPFIVKEVELKGTICYAGDHPRAIELLHNGSFPVSEFISSTISLENIVADGLDELSENAGKHMKIVADLRTSVR